MSTPRLGAQQAPGGFRVVSTPALGAPVSIPGTIEIEEFDDGGAGIAFADTTVANEGGAFRQTAVDLEPTNGGGFNVGWTTSGEWLNYSVVVAASGTYQLEARVASGGQGGTFHVDARGANITGLMTIPNTGDWQVFQTISRTVTLSEGQQTFTLTFDSNGADGVGNIDWLRLTLLSIAEPVGPTSPSPSPLPPTIPSGAVVWVPAGGDLQAAINNAQPGETLMLAAGAEYVGNFTLPVKSGSSYITIRSAAPDSSLPGDSMRMTPAYAASLPKLRSPNSAPALATAPGAHHYRIQFIEFRANFQGYYDVIQLGDGSGAQNSLSKVPHDLVIDRVYIHGDPTWGQKRAIGLNSASTFIVNSYISEIKASGQDSQGIAGWNGPGPYVISNNYIEAAGENVLFGGSDPAIHGLIPSDITFTRNYLTKQLVWRSQPQFTVKNLFELKNAQRVVIDGNIMENNWVAAQSGYAILFTVRNQDGGAPWSILQQIQFTNNIVRHSASGINILATDYLAPSQTSHHIVIRNNLFDDISAVRWGGSGRFLLLNGGSDITVDHNTVVQDGWNAVYVDTNASTNFTFTNNIIPDYSWGILGNGTAPGNGTVLLWLPGATVLSNIWAGSNQAAYPANNFYPANLDAVGFVDLPHGDFRLASWSAYRGRATDGGDVGCNITALNAATAGVQ